MISHSVITAVWMLLALVLYALAGLSPFVMAAIITAWWWSREQYWAELKLRDNPGPVIWPLQDVVTSTLSVWRPTQKNMDLIAPTIVAWVLATVFVLAAG